MTSMQGGLRPTIAGKGQHSQAGHQTASWSYPADSAKTTAHAAGLSSHVLQTMLRNDNQQPAVAEGLMHGSSRAVVDKPRCCLYTAGGFLLTKLIQQSI